MAVRSSEGQEAENRPLTVYEFYLVAGGVSERMK